MKRITIAVALSAVFLFAAGCSEDQQPVSPSESAEIGDVLLAKGKCPEIEIIFQSDGGVKDFTIIKRDTDFHIFHITDPLLPIGGEVFGHAMSTDLQDWTYFERIDLRHEDWSGDYTWAPHVIEEDGVYYMFYTGVELEEGLPLGDNWQRIGLATSTDLFDWTLYNGNGLVLDGPWYYDYPWCEYGTPVEEGETNWNNDCRDPFVYNTGTEYVMLVSICRNTGPDIEWEPMGIALAISQDLVNWEWSHLLGIPFYGKMESPNLVKLSDTYFLMWTYTDANWNSYVYLASTTDDITDPDAEWNTDHIYDGLYGYANETIINDDYMIYAAIVDDYDYNGFDMRLKKVAFDLDEPVAVTWDFTTCDFFTKPEPNRPH